MRISTQLSVDDGNMISPQGNLHARYVPSNHWPSSARQCHLIGMGNNVADISLCTVSAMSRIHANSKPESRTAAVVVVFGVDMSLFHLCDKCLAMADSSKLTDE